MMNQTHFLLHFSSHKKASIIVRALSPENPHKIPRSTVIFSLDGALLKLTIKAKDISSLRAACNSYLRLIQTALAVEEVIQKK